ncbi:cell division protein FtsZ, partial [Bacteroides ovatus]
LNDNDIEKAQKLLYIIYSSKENPILINELSELNTFMEELDPNIEVIWGLYDDDSLGEDVKITLIATGFDNKKDSVNAEISDDVRLKSEIEKYYKPTPEPLSKQVQSAIVESNNDTKEEITETQEPITFEETTSHSTKEKLITRLSNIISKLMEDE